MGDDLLYSRFSPFTIGYASYPKSKIQSEDGKIWGKRDLIVEFPPSRKFYYIAVFPGGKSARGEKRLYNIMFNSYRRT